MYQKVLIPLDGTTEAEKVFATVKEELAPDCEVILLQVIPPGKTLVRDGHVFISGHQEEDERSKAMVYLKGVIERLGGGPESWRREITIQGSVAQGIADVASRMEADLIAMYTHDRKGIAKVVQRSVAKAVQRRAPTVVKVFKPHELVPAA